MSNIEELHDVSACTHSINEWQGSDFMTEPKHVPFPRSYWVVPDTFLAGFYPGDRNRRAMEQKVSALLECGIRHIVNLMEEDETDHDGKPFVAYETLVQGIAEQFGFKVACERTPIRDLGIPTRETMVKILDGIDGAIAVDRPVYVHCWGGRGRTGTVVGCWLVRHGIAEGQAALHKIQKLRRYEATANYISPETRQQRQMVLNWLKGN